MDFQSSAKGIGFADLNPKGLLLSTLSADDGKGAVGESFFSMTPEQAEARGFVFGSEPKLGETVQVLGVDRPKWQSVVKRQRQTV